MGFQLADIIKILEIYGNREVLDTYFKERQAELKKISETAEYQMRLLDTARRRLRKEQNMSYDVSIKTIPERYAATVHMTIPRYEDEWKVWQILNEETGPLNVIPADPCLVAAEYLDDEYKEEDVELVGLDPEQYRSRYPGQLSGGQQQRIGLARALATDPKIMLLDEPFGAIDAITRLNLQNELKRIHGGTNKTFLLVTHDINEAFKLGSRVMIMNEGRLLQFDTPEEIVRHPADPFVEMLIRSAREQESFWESVFAVPGETPELSCNIQGENGV